MKIGLVKPSSNVTMERELPKFIPNAVFNTTGIDLVDVTEESLNAMNTAIPNAAKNSTSDGQELVVSVCLVATMLAPGGHEGIEQEMEKATGVKAISSAGALVRQLIKNNHKQIAVIAPYTDGLMARVVSYLADRGIAVTVHKNFGVVDNTAVAQISTDLIVDAALAMDLAGVDALVVSACVQMPSYAALHNKDLLALGLPLMSASMATAIEIRDSFAIC